MTNLDLLNAEGLDDSLENAVGDMTANYEYSSCCGVDGYSNLTNQSLFDKYGANGYSNTDGGEGEDAKTPDKAASKDSVTPEMIQAGIGTTTAIIQGIQQKRATQEGQDKIAMRKMCGRKPLIGNKKKAEYQKCVSDFIKSKQQSTQQQYVPDPSQQRTVSPDASGDGKVLGVPKGVAIAIGVVVLAVGGYFAIKAIKK